MKLRTKLATNVVVAGALIGVAVLLKKLVRSRRGEHVAPTTEASFGGDLGATASLDQDLVVIATESGIANVDPEPLSQVAGEGSDVDGDIAAHQKIAELRERLPRP